MSGSYIAALVVGAALFFSLPYALRVTNGAFDTSPMERLVGFRQRTAALWILMISVIYIEVVGYHLVGRAPQEWRALLMLLLWVLGGVGPIAWWFVSRQAHAQFDGGSEEAPAFTVEWLLRRAVRQYVRAWPNMPVGVVVRENGLEHCLYITWTTTDQKEHTRCFWFDSRGEAARFYGSFYAINPDTNQFNTLQFRNDGEGTVSRAKLSLNP